MTDKNVQLAVLGVVAVIAVVGLVLLFTTARSTGMMSIPNSGDFGRAVGSYSDANGQGMDADAQRYAELKKQQDFVSAGKEISSISTVPTRLA